MSKDNIVQALGTCNDCGKLMFTKRKDARAYARKRLPNEQMSVYSCGNYFHYGHNPQSIARGAVSRASYGGRGRYR